MSIIRRNSRLLLVAVCCLAVGAGASAIATAGASTTSTNQAAHAARAGARFRLRRLALRAVHGTVVVHTKTGFVTVTFDRGTVDSVSGQQLTITEGTPKASYQKVTLTIPTTATVRDNRQAASLSQLTAGERVIVVSAPTKAWVIAHTPRTTS
jgi:L-fucose isomerase-like protein